jgi:hypothetical protein
MQAATEMMHTAEMHLQEQAAEASFVLICSRLHRHRHNKTPKTGASRSPGKRAYESHVRTMTQAKVWSSPSPTLLYCLLQLYVVHPNNIPRYITRPLGPVTGFVLERPPKDTKGTKLQQPSTDTRRAKEDRRSPIRPVRPKDCARRVSIPSEAQSSLIQAKIGKIKVINICNAPPEIFFKIPASYSR